MHESFSYYLSQSSTRRLQRIGVAPDVQHILLKLLQRDIDWMETRWHWGTIIPAVCAVLGGTDAQVAPFRAAWSLMYAAIVRLDHYQDNDPEADSLSLSSAATYNLLLTYYVLATSLLDDLDHLVPPQRERRLRRLWSNMMLRTAGGQQQDLIVGQGTPDSEALDSYQQIAQAKTGSTFALAFGGAAALLLDDRATVDTCIIVGDLFGTLVQYQDDLADVDHQSNPTMTLPTAFQQLVAMHADTADMPTTTAFWAYLYQAYRNRADDALAACSAPIRNGLLHMFDTTFDPQRRSSTPPASHLPA